MVDVLKQWGGGRGKMNDVSAAPALRTAYNGQIRRESAHTRRHGKGTRNSRRRDPHGQRAVYGSRMRDRNRASTCRAITFPRRARIKPRSIGLREYSCTLYV